MYEGKINGIAIYTVTFVVKMWTIRYEKKIGSLISGQVQTDHIHFFKTNTIL